MASLIIALAGGDSEPARSYELAGDVVRIRRPDGSELEVERAAVDLEQTLEQNAGRDFATAADAAEPAEPPGGGGEPNLQIESRAESASGPYRIVEGSVKNLTRKPLGDVVARVVAEDDRGRLVTAEEALVDFNPLKGGATSSFRVVMKAPAELHLRLTFRALLGDEIAAVEE